MATLRTTNLQHPASAVPNLVLQADGTVGGPGAGGLVAVRHVLKTDAESFTSVAQGDNRAVTGLEITHEVADPDNRLIITAYLGAAGNSGGRGEIGIAVAEEGVFIGVGAEEGSRPRVGAGGWLSDSSATRSVRTPSITFVHTPGGGEKTYTVHVFSLITSTQTLFINRNQEDGNNAIGARTASALVIQEVKV